MVWIFELIRTDVDVNGLQSAKSPHNDGSMRIEGENGSTRKLKEEKAAPEYCWWFHVRACPTAAFSVY